MRSSAVVRRLGFLGSIALGFGSAALGLAALVVLAGCGQKGPLYLPDHNAQVVTRAAASSSSTAASSSSSTSTQSGAPNSGR